MAFKLVLFVAICLAQGLAFDPTRLLQRRVECNNPTVSFETEVDQAVADMDAIREEVSLAAMEAYATGKNVKVAVACFVQQSPNYIKLGATLAQKMTKATVEMAGDLAEKADKYAERMAEPVKVLTITFTTVPVRVYNYIQNKQFLKAARLMLEARRVIKTNSILLGEAIRDMVSEVPEMADKAEGFAKDIYLTASTNSRAIREAYGKCVEQGGPKRPIASSEEGSSEE